MLRCGPAAWAGLCCLLALLTLLGWGRDPGAIDWQPARAASQPWRAWTAVAVHYSGLHLAANLAGAVLVGALGVAARVGPREVIALLIAWPLTQAGLSVQPALAHYGGLSGVLHAAVAVVGVHLLAQSTPARRRIGAALLGGLLLKVLVEAPWGAPLRHPEGWDIAVAPLAHASGALAGLLAAKVLRLLLCRPAAGTPS